MSTPKPLDDVQRRGLENLRSLLVDIKHRTETAEAQARELMSGSAAGGFLAEARRNVQFVADVIDAVLEHASSAEWDSAHPDSKDGKR